MEKTRKRAAGGGDGRDRPRKAPKPVFDRTIQPPAGLVAKNPPPQPKLKHQAYFEFVENTNKKKQLDYQVDPNSLAERLCRAIDPISNPDFADNRRQRASSGLCIRTHR